MLVVEDHSEMRALLREFLQSAFPEYSVAGAADGKSALELVHERRPKLVLMDINLPDASGVELTRRIRAIFPDTKVIVVTEKSGSAYVERACAAGAFAYVTKDRIYHELLPAAAHALGVTPKGADRLNEVSWTG